MIAAASCQVLLCRVTGTADRSNESHRLGGRAAEGGLSQRAAAAAPRRRAGARARRRTSPFVAARCGPARAARPPASRIIRSARAARRPPAGGDSNMIPAAGCPARPCAAASRRRPQVLSQPRLASLVGRGSTAADYHMRPGARPGPRPRPAVAGSRRAALSQ